MLYVTHRPAEAVALGTRLFLLRDGRIIADGPPLDILAAARPRRGRRCRSTASATSSRPWSATGAVDPRDGRAARRRPGPDRPRTGRPPGTRLVVAILADDILLARGPVAGLSARNLIAGEVGRIVPHGDEAEVVVHAGDSRWVVSVVASAVVALGLAPGTDVG